MTVGTTFLKKLQPDNFSKNAKRGRGELPQFSVIPQFLYVNM